MSPQPPKSQLSSTYFVQDRSNKSELARLALQDHLVTKAMDGVMSEQSDPALLHKILDVGCGTGGWLIETARTYPTISTLVGIDISSTIIEYARARTATEGIADRVQFHVMDALRQLEFPDASFDLVNQRFGMSYLRTWDWPKLISEYIRITKPTGVIRLTETSMSTEGTTSPALARLFEEIAIPAFYRAGHLFTKDAFGVTRELPHLLQQYGLHNIQTQVHKRLYKAGTPEWERYYEDVKLSFQTMLPFLNKWIRLPDNYDALYQQALREIQQPDFIAPWTIFTTWAIR